MKKSARICARAPGGGTPKEEGREKGALRLPESAPPPGQTLSACGAAVWDARVTARRRPPSRRSCARGGRRSRRRPGPSVEKFRGCRDPDGERDGTPLRSPVLPVCASSDPDPRSSLWDSNVMNRDRAGPGPDGVQANRDRAQASGDGGQSLGGPENGETLDGAPAEDKRLFPGALTGGRDAQAAENHCEPPPTNPVLAAPPQVQNPDRTLIEEGERSR